MLGQADWDAVGQIFCTLNRWRHLPDYQLERRSDIFFTPYLAGLIAERFNKSICPIVIPEFPLKKEASRRSTKVDYALFAEDHSQVYFVELKTDDNSRNRTQDAYLARAQTIGFRQLLMDLLPVFQGTTAKRKYVHLLYRLQQAGQIQLRNDLMASLYPERRRVRYGDDCFQVIVADAPIAVVYIQPTGDQNDVISFEAVSKHVSRFSDPFSQAFSTYLLRWKEPAAAIGPKQCDE
jgi:hypothetical protein